MIDVITSKDVEHYGKLISDCDMNVVNNFIRQKVYSYHGRVFLLTCVNGKLMLFSELNREGE